MLSQVCRVGVVRAIESGGWVAGWPGGWVAGWLGGRVAGWLGGENAWEEDRGMAHSFGYIHTERFEDHNRSETLTLMPPLSWHPSGENLVITVPALTPSEAPCDDAWTFKVSKIVQ